MADQESNYHTLICDNCFKISECETRTECWQLGGGMQGNFLVWACPECGNKHTLEIEENLTEAIHAYNQHIQTIITGLEHAAESQRNKEPNPEEDAYFRRFKEAEERDQAEGGNKHVRRVKFGWWVRRLRLWHGTLIPGQKLTIAAAARGAGVSREYWTRLELGQEGYSEDVVLRVGAVVGGTVEMALRDGRSEGAATSR